MRTILSSHAEIQNSLWQEILQLEERLQGQVSIHCALERALGFGASSIDITSETIMPNPAVVLTEEIAALELEVGHLEQYLLSLHRKAWDQQISSLSPSKRDDFSRSDNTRKEFAPEAETRTPSNSRKGAIGPSRYLKIHLWQKYLPPADALGKALCACRSQPLSMMEYCQDASLRVTSLAELLGTHISDHIPDTPNTLSQDIVKCMCDIYCRLADPPLSNHGLSSPTSSLSSMGAVSPKDQRDLWSMGLRNNTCDFRLDNPFHLEGLKRLDNPFHLEDLKILVDLTAQ